MTAQRFCTRCGAALDAHGLCPACMLAAASVAPASTPASETPAPTPAELTEHFPALEILELVGRGGMGFVYRARHRTLERNVALKLLASDVAQRPGFAERFAREARVLAALNHPHIVAVHDHGRAGPWWFLSMEFVEGASLRELMRERSVKPLQALAIVAQICDALQYAHERNVVHRDIKPENILIDRAGRVRILDFGLSKIGGGLERDNLTRADQVMGTPHYMAPEQWERPAEVDHRADIYALGVVFYELLTGELPLGRFAPPSQCVQVDVRLDEVVLKSLEKAPERRYQQASEVKSRVDFVAASPLAAAAVVGAAAVGAAASPPAAPPSASAARNADPQASPSPFAPPATALHGDASSAPRRAAASDAAPQRANVVDTLLGPRRAGDPTRPIQPRPEHREPFPWWLWSFAAISLVLAIVSAAAVFRIFSSSFPF
jgi:serine/threonine protein kinase